MDRIVDIGTEGMHLSAHRGFLLASKDREEVGRIALDDVHAVILHAHGCTWSGHLVAALAERGSPIVFCNNHHHPVAVTLPTELPPSEWSIDYDSLDQGRDDDAFEEAQAGGDHRQAA